MAALLFSHLFYVVSHLKNVQTVDHMYTGLQSMQIKHYYAMNTKKTKIIWRKNTCLYESCRIPCLKLQNQDVL